MGTALKVIISIALFVVAICLLLGMASKLGIDFGQLMANGIRQLRSIIHAIKTA